MSLKRLNLKHFNTDYCLFEVCDDALVKVSSQLR